MEPTFSMSHYWQSSSAAGTLQRISQYEEEKSYRPTVVVPIVDYVGRPLIVQLNTREGQWGLVQGHIETSDAHPLAAGLREAYEEAFVTEEKVDAVFPCLEYEGIEFPHQAVGTGYARGGYYISVGIRLRPGADVSVVPPPSQPQSLLQYRWCSSLDHAISLLREQPGTEYVSETTRQKTERVLIPALEDVYQLHAQILAERR